MSEGNVWITEADIRMKNVDLVLRNVRPMVALVGGTGTGKTAVLNSLTLAVTGAIYDVAGRAKDEASYLIAEILPDDGAEPVIKFTLSTGRVLSPFGADAPVPARLLYQEAEAALIGARVDDRAYPWLFEMFIDDNVVDGKAPAAKPEIIERFQSMAKAAQVKTKKARLLDVYNAAYAGISSYTKAMKPLVITRDTLKAMGQTPPQRINDDIEDCEDNIKELQAVADMADAWMRSAVVANLEPIQAVISTVLPEPWAVKFIREPRMRLALTRDGGGKWRTALSGAETVITLYAVAAAAAVWRRLHDDTSFFLMILPDRWYSEMAVRLIMQMAERTPANTWMQMVTPPRGNPRDDFTYVYLDDEHKHPFQAVVGE